MEIIRKKVEIDTLDKRDLVLDIETTGFSPEDCMISLLSYIIYEDDGFHSVQLFASEGHDRDLLKAFKDELKPGHRLLSYNGKTFDIPFIKRRMEKEGIDFDLANDHLDLYSFLRSNQDFSKYPAVGQKKLEILYGLGRDKEITGKQAVNMYKIYMERKDERIKDELVHYNFLDVYNLAQMKEIYHGVMEEKSLEAEGQTLYIDKMDLVKDRLVLYLDSQLIPDYEIDVREEAYSLSWSSQIRLNLDLIRGLIDEGTKGQVFPGGLDLGLVDQSSYSLQLGLVLVKDEEGYHLTNIKAIGQAVMARALAQYRPILRPRQ